MRAARRIPRGDPRSRPSPKIRRIAPRARVARASRQPSRPDWADRTGARVGDRGGGIGRHACVVVDAGFVGHDGVVGDHGLFVHDRFVDTHASRRRCRRRAGCRRRRRRFRPPPKARKPGGETIPGARRQPPDVRADRVQPAPRGRAAFPPRQPFWAALSGCRHDRRGAGRSRRDRRTGPAGDVVGGAVRSGADDLETVGGSQFSPMGSPAARR